MSNLLASLVSTAGALNAYNQVLDVTQNNVANASTPGYAKQRQLLYAMPFDPSLGSTGGVRAGTIQSSRDQYAEQAVRQQSSLLGQAQQNVNSYTAMQSLFDISGGSGVPSALNKLFQSFSAWGQTPGSTVARQTVIERATDVATAFRQTATGLTKVSQDTGQQVNQTVDQVNRLTSQLAGFNTQMMRSTNNDAGLEAQLNATLEELSQYVDITAAKQGDRSVTVLLNGQIPLLIGDQTFALHSSPISPDPSAPYPAAPPTARILASDGKDVTLHITTGQLGSLLNLANTVLPGYLGDATHAGDLNTMAQTFAKRVNDLLINGYAIDGAPPQAGVALFTYDQDHPTNVAMTIGVDPTVTTDQLAAISPGPPLVSNGVPLALSQLSSPQSPDDEIGGASYSEFFGGLAARVGSGLNDATSQLQVQQSTLAQAQSLRQQLSGVSLDEEATILIQFQRAYEANSKLISVLDQLTQDTINILRT